MAIYRIFLWTPDGSADVSANAACGSDREARELAQRMLKKEGRGGRAEVWNGIRFVGLISPISPNDA